MLLQLTNCIQVHHCKLFKVRSKLLKMQIGILIKSFADLKLIILKLKILSQTKLV